jgi:hypothetical protein
MTLTVTNTPTPPCPTCGAPTLHMQGRRGPFLRCTGRCRRDLNLHGRDTAPTKEPK